MKKQLLIAISTAVLCIGFAGCKKKPIARTTPLPPAPAASSAPVESTPRAARDVPPQPSEVAASNPERMPDAATKARIQDLLNRIQDAYFDYNKHSLRPDAETALKQDVGTLAEIIKQYPDFKLTIEGHCDERGSDEYNLALGEARAKQARDYLATMGLPANQLKVISYGREKPFCTEHDEACWQKNRVAHITQAQ